MDNRHFMLWDFSILQSQFAEGNVVILQSLCAGGQNLIVVDGEIERQKGRDDSQGKIEIVCVCVERV